MLSGAKRSGVNERPRGARRDQLAFDSWPAKWRIIVSSFCLPAHIETLFRDARLQRPR